MTLKMYATTCGEISIGYDTLRSTETGHLRVPVGSYLIEHPRGSVLFDTGINPEIYRNYDKYVPEYAKHDREFFFGEGDDIASRLSNAGFDPTGIDFVINSHLHHDHCGGNSLIPNAEIIVQEREYNHALRQSDDYMAYRRQDFDTGQPIRTIDGEFDLFGDGSVVCIPSYGHTPGHQSLRVTSGEETYILCADSCYLSKSLDDLVLPLNVTDADATLQVLQDLQRMRDEGVKVYVGHDPEFWKEVPQAPERII